MKTNAIVRIVLFSLTILVLLGLLLAGLGFHSFSFDRDVKIITAGEPGAEGVQGHVDAAQIHHLEIEWVAGDITILPNEKATEITFYEDAVSDEKYAMHYSTSGDTLTIQFCRESISFPSFGVNISSSISKDLVITVPASWVCQDLELDTAAANLEIRDLNIRAIDFDGAAGTFDLVNCTVGDMDIDTASGDVTFSGVLDTLDFDAASASFYGVLHNAPRFINMDGVSGALDLTLPQDCGFTVDTSGLSSSFHSDFDTTQSGSTHVYGDGTCRISVDGVSCDVTIRKGE